MSAIQLKNIAIFFIYWKKIKNGKHLDYFSIIFKKIINFLLKINIINFIPSLRFIASEQIGYSITIF